LPPAVRCYGSDRDAGAIAMAQANAERAGVAEYTAFRQRAVSDLAPPEGPAGPGTPGLVIVNPPYGTRIGDRKALVPLYRALGQVLLTRFPGWRVGLITSEPTLARATGLPFLAPAAPVPHGGLRVALYRTEALP
jgi:putative N6-adenine-specific DNA methylase